MGKFIKIFAIKWSIKMHFEEFTLERNQSLFENKVEYNLSESGVHPLKISEVLSEKEMEEVLDMELFYGYTNGSRN